MFGLGNKEVDNTAPVEAAAAPAGESTASSAEIEVSKSPDSNASNTGLIETAPDTSAADPSADPALPPSPEAPAPELPASPVAAIPEPPAPKEVPYVAPEVGMSDIAKGAFGSSDFHDFVSEKIMKFLSIMDIENPGRRRSAVIAQNLGEEGIVARLALAAAFLNLQAVYGLENGLPEMVEESKNYTLKLAAMKQWLTIK